MSGHPARWYASPSRDGTHVVTSVRRYGAVQLTNANGGVRDRDITPSAPKPASPVQLVSAASGYTAPPDIRMRRPRASRGKF